MLHPVTKRHPKIGSFGVLEYPESTLDVKTEIMVRYSTQDRFEKVSAFYREHYGDLGRHVQLVDGEHDGHPTLCVAVGPGYSDVEFSVLMVMADPVALKRGKEALWILVTRRE